MDIKKLCCIALFYFNCLPSFSQVIITEIFYDTPYSERYNYINPTGKHHLGEFIELYNYSTEDVSLKGWFITDKVSKYSFPDDLTIPSESFIIVAYKTNSENYFSSFFPNTQGMDSQIFYQGNILLRNLREEVKLHMGEVRGKDFNGFVIQTADWHNPNVTSNEDQNYNTPANVNFYLYSLHLGNDGSFSHSPATPLFADYVPATQNMEDIDTYRDATLHTYSSLTWEEYSNAILAATCSLVIPVIQQSPFQDSSQLKKCFKYDLSGNYTHTIVCNDEQQERQVEINDEDSENEEYSSAELENIDSRLVLSPNPTSSIVNVSWDEYVMGKISKIQVFSTNSALVFALNINPFQSSLSIDLSNQPSGIYLVEFLLDSGQSISRNVIKI